MLAFVSCHPTLLLQLVVAARLDQVDGVPKVGAKAHAQLGAQAVVVAEAIEFVHRLAELDPGRVERRYDAARRADDVRPHAAPDKQHE